MSLRVTCRRLGARLQGGWFHSPLHRGMSLRVRVIVWLVALLGGFQSPLHRGMSLRGDLRSSELIGRLAEFQSPLHRGMSLRATDKRSSGMPWPVDRSFNPLFIGACRCE